MRGVMVLCGAALAYGCHVDDYLTAGRQHGPCGYVYEQCGAEPTDCCPQGSTCSVAGGIPGCRWTGPSDQFDPGFFSRRGQRR